MIHNIALTIKPTLSCNMRCKHCFNGDDLNTAGIVDVDAACSFLEIAAKEHEDVKVTFHGGEPSLAGVEFYQKIFSYEHQLTKKYGTVFVNYFTTNGLNLEDGLLSLLMENNVIINVSFDGPYNDVLRQYSDKVYQNIRKLQELGVKIRIFCTISEGSYQNLKEIYDWFKEKNLSFKIAPVQPRGYACDDLNMIMDPKKFVAELEKVYRFWIKDKDCKIRIYTFEEFADLRRPTQFKPYWFKREIALNPDGKIYPFGRPNDVNFCLGSPNEVEKISDCFEASEYKRMTTNIENLWECFCGSCESVSVCNGMVISMSYVYGEDLDMIKYACDLANEIFTTMLAVNDEIITDFENGKTDEYTNTIKMKFSKYLKK